MIDAITYQKITSIISMSSIPFMFTLAGDFVFDDSEAIVKNHDVTSDSWSELFFHDFWGSNITSEFSHKSYRPLTVLTFRFQFLRTHFPYGANLYYVFRFVLTLLKYIPVHMINSFVVINRLNYLYNDKELSATQFKITNLMCHSICCVLVWQAAEKIISRVNYVLRVEYTIDLGYTSALLFSSLPVHTEAVSGIVGRADILAGITFFLSFLAYDKAMDNTNKKFLFILIHVILAGCAMLFKENGITVLGFCIVYELVVNCKIKTNGTIHLCKNAVTRIACNVIAATCLLYTRWMIMGGTSPVFKPTDNPAAFSNDNFVKIATYNYIYFLNLLLFIWPQWLCYDWSMGCIPLIKSIYDFRMFLVFMMYAFGLLFFVSIFISNKRNSTKRLLLISIALIIVPFLPASNIFYPVGFVIAERILYISSVGYCLIVCVSFNKLVQIDKTRLWSLFFFCLTLVIYDGRSWKRSQDWQSEQRLFFSGIAVCPLNAKIHYNAAKAADADNMTSIALQEYREAIRLYPEYYQAMNNLANLLKNEKKYKEAEIYLRTAISHKKDFPAAWMNLGIVYASTNRHDQALHAYKTALSYRSNYPDCHYNIGNLYLDLNKTEEAMKHWYKAISLKSTHAPAWTNLIALLDNTGQRDRALQIIPNALKELPNSGSINFILANIYGKMDKYEEAEKYFLNAISLFGRRVQSVHYSNLGVLYHRWKKYDLAEEMYRKALNLDPNSTTILKNMSKLHKIQKKETKEP